jgi:hypothetical protein
MTVQHTDVGIALVTDRRRWSYCLEHGPLTAPATGDYKFALDYDAVEGAAQLGILSADKSHWLPSTSTETIDKVARRLQVSARLRSGQVFWLMLSNNHPAGDEISRLVVRQATVAVDVRDAISVLRDSIARMIAQRHAIDWRAPWLKAAMLTRAATRKQWDRIRSRLIDGSLELAAARQAARPLEEELAQLSHLRDLDHVYKLLQERRPEPLHLNGCGDFQLMALENWSELRGYPEFQTFSMNIDGLLSSVAYYAGIKERVLESPCCIYHLEHEVGSGWTPEGEALLRRRVAERGITWLDARDVFVWSAYMHWLDRPMIFNKSDWGLGACEFQQRTIQPLRIDQAASKT